MVSAVALATDFSLVPLAEQGRRHLDLSGMGKGRLGAETMRLPQLQSLQTGFLEGSLRLLDFSRHASHRPQDKLDFRSQMG